MDKDDTKLADETLGERGRMDTVPAPPRDPLIGTMLDDRYQLEELLGEGGMGYVYKAQHVLMGKSVAVKLIHAELAHIDDIAKRFEREAKSSSKLTNPHCITVTDFGRTDENQLYLAMELLDGEDLDDRLTREGKLIPGVALDITAQILKGLGHAHEQGVIHRDLKPENIYLTKDDDGEDFVKILDFGIAKMASDSGESKQENLTKTGMVFGTPKYLSPEQALGDKTDHRADLYAVGIMLYEMLTGEPPYSADTAMDTLSMQLTAPIPKLSQHGSFPRHLQKAINKAMAKKPQDRFKDAQMFLEAIEAVDLSENSEITITLPNIVPGPKLFTNLIERVVALSWSSLKRKIITIGSLLGIICVVILIAMATSGPSEEPYIKKDAEKAPVVVPDKPDETTTGNKEVLEFLAQAKDRIDSGRPEEAQVLARKALAVDPKLPGAKMLLGHALFASDKLVGALYQYQQAIDLDKEQAKDARFLDNVREGLQWEDIRKKSAVMLASYGTEDDVTKLAELCNSALTNGDVRRAARNALEKTGNKDQIDWVSTLTADFHELKGCKERNNLIAQMVKTGDEAFIEFLEEFRPKSKKGKKGPKKTENACIRGSVDYAIRKLSGEDVEESTGGDKGAKKP